MSGREAGEAGLLESGLDWLSAELQPANDTKEEEAEATEDPFFRDSFFHPDLIADDEPCKAILTAHVSGLRVWDLAILLPNIAFLVFLFYRLSSTRQKLRSTNSQLHRSLFSLALACSLASALRCLLAMLLHLDSPQHDTANKVVWVAGRFVLLTGELSVAAFAGAFGVPDSRAAVRRVTLGCGLLALVVCAVQAYLEIYTPFYGLQVSNGLDLYGQGGPAVWAVTSLLLALLHLLLLLAPLLRPALPALLPSAPGLTLYCALQLALHSLTAAGALMLATNLHSGLCLTNITSFVSFALFPSLVYACFLHSWLATTQSGLLFAYTAQLDDTDDTVGASVQSFRQDSPGGRDRFVNQPIHDAI